MSYICEVCNKGFTNSQAYQDHMNIHTGAKPHKCPYCPATFASVGTAYGHRRAVHEGKKRNKWYKISLKLKENKDALKTDQIKDALSYRLLHTGFHQWLHGSFCWWEKRSIVLHRMKSLEPKILEKNPVFQNPVQFPRIEGLLNHDFKEHVNGGFKHVSHAPKASRRKKNLTTTRGSFSATFVGSPTPVRTDSSTTQKRDCLAPGDSFYGFEEVKLEDHVMWSRLPPCP